MRLDKNFAIGFAIGALAGLLLGPLGVIIVAIALVVIDHFRQVP